MRHFMKHYNFNRSTEYLTSVSFKMATENLTSGLSVAVVLGSRDLSSKMTGRKEKIVALVTE